MFFQAICLKYQVLVKDNADSIIPEAAFYLASIWKLEIPNCQEFPTSVLIKVMCDNNNNHKIYSSIL